MNESTAAAGAVPTTTGVGPTATGAQDTDSAATQTPFGEVVAPDPIFQIASGFMAAKHLFVANEVGVFAGLAKGPLGLDELAKHTDVAQHRLRILADAMVALGLLQRRGEQYQNGPVAAAFLAGDTAVDLRPFLRFWDRLSYPMWTRFADAVRTGRGQSPPQLSEDEQRLYSEGVEAIQAAPAHALPASYDFSHHERLLDLGGGTGSWLLAVLRHYGHLRTTLFELPGAAALARQRLADTDPLTLHVEVVDGDFFHDPLPTGHDAVLIANVMHLFSPDHNKHLLHRTRASVADRARLLLADFWTDPTHTDPAFAALMAGEFLVITGEGDVYSAQEVTDWLDQTGWRVIDRKPLAGPMTLIIAETVGKV
jgi:ubiquinone/menaquinone biosynthesis C-methylase UbiE